MKIQKLLAVILLLTSQVVWADGETPNKYAVVFDSISLESSMFKKHIQNQADVLVKLWKQGKVENVYLNHQSNKPMKNRKANIVFFINADSKDEANKTLKQLPFVEHNVLSYELHPVGILWLERYNGNIENR